MTLRWSRPVAGVSLIVAATVAVFAPGADGDVAPTRTITSFEAGIPFGDVAIDKVRTPPRTARPGTRTCPNWWASFRRIAHDGDD